MLAQSKTQTPSPSQSQSPVNPFKMPTAIHTRLDASVANSLGLQVGMEAEGVLKAFRPTRNDEGFMLEIVVANTYTVMTFAKTSTAKLASTLGGKVLLTFKGIDGDYANFSPKFII